MLKTNPDSMPQNAADSVIRLLQILMKPTGPQDEANTVAINVVNQKMWGGRAKQGLVTLSDHAEQGYGLMPAKGGKEHLTREELELAIIYMISALEKP